MRRRRSESGRQAGGREVHYFPCRFPRDLSDMVFETATPFDLGGPQPGLPAVADRVPSLLDSWRRRLKPAPLPLPAAQPLLAYGSTIENFLNSTWEISTWRCHR